MLKNTDQMGFIDDFLLNGSIITYREKKLFIGWGKRSWMATQPKSGTKTFYFPDFFLEDRQPWFTHEHTLLISLKELISKLRQVSYQSDKSLDWNTPDRDLYQTMFRELKENYLQVGTLDKGVPFVSSGAKGTMTPFQIAQSLLSLLKVYENSSCYVYGFWDESQGILGATPEILFKKEQNTEEVETVACAGTCSSNSEASSFLNDPKELMEHQYVIDGIKNSLSIFGKLSVHEMKILHLPHLKHMYTPITLSPRHHVSFEELVKALHPTPALGAYPKKEGNVWLRGIQKIVDRRRFGAPVGFVDHDTGLYACYVAIRNVQWSDDEVRVFAGGGVVSQSELEKEWNEILLKLNTVKKMLALETPS